MSEETAAAAPGASAGGPPTAGSESWSVLDMRERRVLGVLVEKQKTSKTADTYPLTLNALTTGCNQKSNRDPVLTLEEEEVEQTLLRCLKKNLVARVTSTRVMRWRHLLYEAWHVDKLELAILAELLLRGPQTEGELRTHVNRMEPLDDLDALRAALKPLVERKLVLYVTPEDRRGAMVAHGFHDPRELDRLKARIASEPASLEPASSAGAAQGPDLSGELQRLEARLGPLESGLNAANVEIASLKETIGDLQAMIATLQQELRSLKQSLGG